ncbi:MSH2 protein [Balamuthia mandrillaris]
MEAPRGSSAQRDAAKDAFVRFYGGLQDVPNLIRIFDRKEVYSLYGKDAIFVAQEYFKTLAAVQPFGSKQLESIDLKQEKFEEVVRSLLLDKNKKVELWSRKPNTDRWEVTKKASPGNLQHFEDLLWRHAPMANPAVTVAIRIGEQAGQRVVGVAFADATLRIMGVCQLLDNHHFSNLESLLVQVGARECLVCLEQIPAYAKKITNLFERCNVVCTTATANSFRTTNLEQDLGRLLIDQNIRNLPVMELKFARAALACVMNYLELVSNSDNHGQFHLEPFDLSRCMRLDQAAVRALNLLPSSSDANKNFSLYGLLNKCKTAMGMRRLMQWIKQPLLSISEIEERLDLVELLQDDVELRTTLQDHLQRVPDLFRVCKRFYNHQRNQATLKDCVTLYDVAQHLPLLLHALQQYRGKYDQLLYTLFTQKLAAIVADFGPFDELIQGTVNLEAAASGEYLLNPNFDTEFAARCKERQDVREAIDLLYQKAQDDLQLDSKKITLENSKMWDWHLKLSKRFNKNVQTYGKKHNYSVLESQGKFIRITTPKLNQLSRQLSDLDDQLHRRQQALVQDVLEVVETYVPLVEDLTALLADLDVLVSFAHVALSAPRSYCRPKLTPADGDIILRDARHPCLEVQDDVDFMPNDVELVRDQSMFQIITGPNMGGKSTYIRQVGVIVLMAQIGCFVPCSSATICITDSILSRIGASDSQLRGVSTFMAEMQETAAILKSATNHSLIIIDELGRGTSTYDGFGLAWAISEYICKNKKCFCFFATHFHELTRLENHLAGVKNLHVTAEIQDQRLVLLYKIQQGPSDRSFGIQIAEMAGFPANVIEAAKEKVSVLEKSHQRKEEEGNGVKGDFRVGGKRKAPEASSSSSSSAGSSSSGCSSARSGAASIARKRSPQDIAELEGKRAIKQFLEQVAKLQLDNMAPSEALRQLQQLQEQLPQDNPFVARFLRK